MKDDKDNEAENIRVAVRCRPMNERELREQAVSCFTAENGNAVLTNLENPTERYEFGYDHVYGIDTPQQQVFLDIGAPILDRAFGGYNGTIFAYGQTGSGKTFSMSGVRGNESLEGLIPRMNKAIFERIRADKADNPSKLFLVECSFFEIYNEIIYDLLDSSGNAKKNKGGLEIKEHAVLGIYVKDLQERVVESQEEVIDLMQQGQLARTVGYTQMNAESSRSHSIFVIKIHQKDATDETKNVFAKINLVDLAGSERAASTGAQGDRLKEGANINKSLSALGNVINALVEASRTGKKVFIPYRNSKLTRVLQESLGGNSLCSMLATLSPANINFVETLSTLKYASRAKSIKVNAKKNEASSQISQLNDEIAALKKKLMEQTSATLGLDPKEKEEIVKKYEQQIKEMDRVRLQTWEDKARLSKQHEMERKRLAKEKALADQKVREERTRKWKLLEEKGDVELMLRALRDLDRNPVSNSGASTNEDRWLSMAQAVKSLETKAKDHRTLIMVFKDSLDKDVVQWSKRHTRHDSKDSTSAVAKRDDSAALHMLANQLCSKLQNIVEESKQLIEMESSLIQGGSELINDMMTHLIRFKEYRAASKTKSPNSNGPAPGTSTNPTAPGAKEDEQVLEEREKGLTITLALIQRQRATLVGSIRSERHRIFNLGHVTTQFLSYLDSHLSPAQPSSGESTQGDAKGHPWKDMREALSKVAERWEMEGKKLSADSSDSLPVTFTPIGSLGPLGLETKLINDDCLHTSSKKSDARFTRMNAQQFWLPEEQDQAPFLVVDLEVPRFLRSVAIRGGNLEGPVSQINSRSPNEQIKVGGENQRDTFVISTTFQLKSTAELKETVQRYTFSEITGDHEATYEILCHVMSWTDLLKSAAVPVKLFARPPVRFVHDVISVVIHNTGYAKDIFTPFEKDYSNLVSKTDRADYLTKILDYVQETYRSSGLIEDGQAQSVIIAATASNILAGKEPTDTLKFLSYLALAALHHAIRTPPTALSSPISPKLSSSKEEGLDTNNNMEATLVEPGEQAPKRKAGWVKRLRISTSLTGKQWRVVGDFDGNCDSDVVKIITLDPDVNFVGRYVQMTLLEWHQHPLLQVELFGQEAKESDALVLAMSGMATHAVVLLQQLLLISSAFADEAKTSLEKAKDAEREKQEELAQLVTEIARLKQANATLDREVKELSQEKTTLQQNVKNETKRLHDEKSKTDRLQKEIERASDSISELKKEKEVLSGKFDEQTLSLQSNNLQLSEQRKELESLQKSKADLEELCNTLRGQLQSKHQTEGHQELKLANVLSDLMSVNVQLDEFKRKFETSEEMRKEQECASQQLHTQLQQQINELRKKEAALQDTLKAATADANRGLEVVQAEREDLRKRLDEAIYREEQHKKTKEALGEEVAVLKEEIEAHKQKAIQNPTSPTKANVEDGLRAAHSASESERLVLEAQTKELRCLAELEKMELKLQSWENKQRETEVRLTEVQLERDLLQRRVSELEEQEEELQMQLQVVTEERDASRSKEEQLFAENNEKDQEIERIRDGYVWVTDRMNSKEDELSELQEQLEKYQALLQITNSSTTADKKKVDSANTTAYLHRIHRLTHGDTQNGNRTADDLMKDIIAWIESIKVSKAAPSVSALTVLDQNVPENNVVVPSAATASPTQPPQHTGTAASSPTTKLPAVAVAKSQTVTMPGVGASTSQIAPTKTPDSSVAVEATPQIVPPANSSTEQPPHNEIKDRNEVAVAAPKVAPVRPKSPAQPATGPERKVAQAPSTTAAPTQTNAGSLSKPKSPTPERGEDDGDAYDDDFDGDEDESKRQRRKSSTGRGPGGG